MVNGVLKITLSVSYLMAEREHKPVYFLSQENKQKIPKPHKTKDQKKISQACFISEFHHNNPLNLIFEQAIKTKKKS